MGKVQRELAVCVEGADDYDSAWGVGWSCGKDRCREVDDYSSIVEGVGGEAREYFY